MASSPASSSSSSSSSSLPSSSPPIPTLHPSPSLTLIVRFASSLPDLPIAITNPSLTCGLALIALVRARLPPDLSDARIRLIHAGRVLKPLASLTSSLRLPAATAAAAAAAPPSSSSSSSKGKAPLRPPQTLYVHASLSTEHPLTALERSAEAADAAAADARLARASTTIASAAPSTRTHDGKDVARAESQNPDAEEPSSPTATAGSGRTAPPPQGFDRLLAAGLAGSEVASLRSQFRAIQAHTHTPDTMPSAAEMLQLEEQWLDGGGGAADGAAGFGAAAEDDGLDDMLWGNVMGFFWPLAAVVWLMREEGVWSQRRRIAVGTGMLVNLVFGALRWGMVE